MKTLVIGGSSLLGKYLTSTKPNGIELYSTWFTNYFPGAFQLDVSNQSQIAYVFERVKPQVVIHCAAVGSVDYTERHFTETHAVNVLGVRNVLQAARDSGALFIYISTNAVFSGDNPPYSENSERKPVNRYGSIKREAEQLVMAGYNWLVIRPFLLYGYPHIGGRQNWFTIITHNLVQGKETKLVNDTYWQPTSARDCATTIWKLIELGKKNEVYHVAAQERMTLYDFGLKVAEFNEGDKRLIKPISSSELKNIAPRPVDTTFDLSKLHGLGIELSGVKEGLKNLK